MNKTQASRLLTLARFLKRKVNPQNFSLGSYACERRPRITPDLHNPECGTSACALGWCSVVFPRQFSLTENSNYPFLLFKGEHTQYLSTDIQEFFGVSIDETQYLFGTSNTRTPQQEAAEIEKVVKSHGYVYAD